MQRLDDRHTYRNTNSGNRYWQQMGQRLIYLPGALVLAYGFWLSLNA